MDLELYTNKKARVWIEIRHQLSWAELSWAELSWVVLTWCHYAAGKQKCSQISSSSTCADQKLTGWYWVGCHAVQWLHNSFKKTTMWNLWIFMLHQFILFKNIFKISVLMSFFFSSFSLFKSEDSDQLSYIWDEPINAFQIRHFFVCS